MTPARDTTKYRKIVVKIGTNAIIHNRRLHYALLRSLCGQMYRLRQRGYQIIVVTSGAIGLGANELRLPAPIIEITQRQACAAVGQPLLMHKYREAFLRFRQPIGQVLLTREILRNNRRSIHLQNTIATLLKDGVIPICNENDSVATEELEEKIRDNDLLGAMLAHNFSAHLYIILSDIEGLYSRMPPRPNEKPIPLIQHIDKTIMDIAQKTGTSENSAGYGTGGMYSKLGAINLVTKGGCSAVVASARKSQVLPRVLRGENIGTYFPRR